MKQTKIESFNESSKIPNQGSHTSELLLRSTMFHCGVSAKAVSSSIHSGSYVDETKDAWIVCPNFNMATTVSYPVDEIRDELEMTKKHLERMELVLANAMIQNPDN